MVNSSEIAVTKAAERLLRQYGFDLAGATSGGLFKQWLQLYPPRWIRLAIIEALYQGRYKAICVEQLLAFWSRRGDVQTHFNSEFETMICRNLPRDLTVFEPEPVEVSMTATTKTNRNVGSQAAAILPAPSSSPNPNIDQFQPQAPAELTSHFAEKLNAIAQAWKTSQTPLTAAVTASSFTHPLEITTTTDSPRNDLEENSSNRIARGVSTDEDKADQ
jgi:hypothetical protein